MNKMMLISFLVSRIIERLSAPVLMCGDDKTKLHTSRQRHLERTVEIATSGSTHSSLPAESDSNGKV
jgi:hypothetical protein